MIVERVQVDRQTCCNECGAEMMTTAFGSVLLAVKVGGRVKLLLCERHLAKLVELAGVVAKQPTKEEPQ